MTLAPGTRLGPYQILSPLGAGGMGEVYRAHDAKLNRDVAIKILPHALASDQAARSRFEREAQAVAALSHPNILGIFDFGVDGTTPFAVMELLDGGTLRDALQDGAIPPRKTLEYARQIATGLGAAHAQGITHRDLKPENLFLTRDGRIKILDFGLAKVNSAAAASAPSMMTTSPALTGAGTILGTVGYMSPEQVRGRDVDHRSDIFSFGAILYELLTGQHAFTGDSAVETMNAILKEDPPELTRADATFPPALDRIVRRCLEKSPDERFQSARDLAFALEALSGSQVSSGAIPAVPAVWPTRRWRWAVAALCVTIVGGGAWWTVRQRNPAPSSADQRMPARPSVAVLAFDVVSGGPDIAWLGKGLPLLLVTGLAQTPDLEVIGNERLNDAARQIGATLESVDRSRGGELARARRRSHNRLDQAGRERAGRRRPGAGRRPGGPRAQWLECASGVAIGSQGG